MMIIRDRVRVRELFQGTMYAGAPSTLRFRDGKVFDSITGLEVPTEPMFPVVKKQPGVWARWWNRVLGVSL